MEKSEAHYKKMTETPVSKLILILGVPTTISMLITNIYNIVDTIFVAGIGVAATGATSIVFTLQCVIQALGFMLGHGSGAFVSKALADKNIEESSKYSSSAFFLGLGIGGLLMSFGLIFLGPFMTLLGSTDTILPYAKDYGMWMLIASPFMIGSIVLNNILRYEGRAFFSMIGLVAGGVLNIIGDAIFISNGMGVFGAGLSTCISQVISFLILLILFLKYAQSRLSIKCIPKNFITYWDICRVGFPSFIRQGLTAIGNGVLNNLCGALPTLEEKDAAIAAMGLVQKYSSFVMCVGIGIGQGFQPVSAFNYQAKKYSRVKQGVVFTAVFSTAVVAFLALIGIIFPKSVLELMLIASSKEVANLDKVMEIGMFATRFAAIGIIFLPTSISANMLYQSIRKSGIASLLALLRSGLIFIPAVIILFFTTGLVGIQIAQPISDILAGLASFPFILHFIHKTPDAIDTKNSENTQKSVE